MTNPNNLELNQGDNFIFSIDVSGSMATKDAAGGLSRLEASKEKAILFAKEAGKYDTDGIDVLTFGHQVQAFNNVTGDSASEIIGKLQPNESATMTAEVIQAAYKRHKEIGSEQTFNFIVTDGQPSNPAAVKQAIIDITNDVKDEKEFRILFLTVGVIDPKLQEFLTGLDDDLKGAKYDIVDVKALEAVDFMFAVAGALTD